MLDYNVSTIAHDALWNAMPKRAMLPGNESEQTYLGIAGATTDRDGSARRFRRIIYRTRAILRVETEILGVYTCDLSPEGIGFYSPIQLFPSQKVQLLVKSLKPWEMEIKRCREHDAQCYVCGGLFVAGSLTPSAYRRFFDGPEAG